MQIIYLMLCVAGAALPLFLLLCERHLAGSRPAP